MHEKRTSHKDDKSTEFKMSSVLFRMSKSTYAITNSTIIVKSIFLIYYECVEVISSINKTK